MFTITLTNFAYKVTIQAELGKQSFELAAFLSLGFFVFDAKFEE